MNQLKRLFEIYHKLLLIHIGTKTVDLTFHQASEKFYEKFFDVFHKISEKLQDIEIDEPMDEDKAKQDAYDLIDE